MTYTLDNGLLTNPETNPPTCAGYIFNFSERGAFAPTGRVKINGQEEELTQSQIDEHNQLLAAAEWRAMLKHGRGILYLTPADKNTTAGKLGHYRVSDWPGCNQAFTYHERTSFHNMAGRNGRLDVWFMLDGSRWHGVNIGDNQILRVKRCKK